VLELLNLLLFGCEDGAEGFARLPQSLLASRGGCTLKGFDAELGDSQRLFGAASGGFIGGLCRCHGGCHLLLLLLVEDCSLYTIVKEGYGLGADLESKGSRLRISCFIEAGDSEILWHPDRYPLLRGGGVQEIHEGLAGCFIGKWLREF
jgi:hypothetical protein